MAFSFGFSSAGGFFAAAVAFFVGAGGAAVATAAAGAGAGVGAASAAVVSSASFPPPNRRCRGPVLGRGKTGWAAAGAAESVATESAAAATSSASSTPRRRREGDDDGDDVRAILGLFFLFRLFSLFCPASASEWAWRGREREREDFVSEGEKLCFSSRKKTGGVERGADETTQAVIRPIRSIVPCALWRVILGIKTPARAKNES